MKIPYRKVRTLLLTGMIAGISLTTTSCGDDDDDNPSPTGSTTPTGSQSLSQRIQGTWTLSGAGDESGSTYTYDLTFFSNRYESSYEYCDANQVCEEDEGEGSLAFINDNQIVFEPGTPDADTSLVTNLTTTVLTICDNDGTDCYTYNRQ